MKFKTYINNHEMSINFSRIENKLVFEDDNNTQEIDCVCLSENFYSLIIDGKIYTILIYPHKNQYEICVNQHSYNVGVKNELEIFLSKFGIKDTTTDNKGNIKAQIPGLVIHFFVNIGDKVKSGEKLCILEAMKMENEINSPIDGIIKNIPIKSGTKVEKGDLLMVLEN